MEVSANYFQSTTLYFLMHVIEFWHQQENFYFTTNSTKFILQVISEKTPVKKGKKVALKFRFTISWLF